MQTTMLVALALSITLNTTADTAASQTAVYLKWTDYFDIVSCWEKYQLHPKKHS